ncbi:MAG TPA: cupin domain-containing protein, partial [Polyangiaceae bacterium]|nr:cupin domain-containing protein [Polyangiaceae bacterium]
MDVLRSSNESRLGVWFSSAIATRMPPHTHDAFEVNLVVAGRLTYRVGDVRLVVEPGECILLPQGVVHELLEASTDAAFWVLEGREMHPRLAGDMAARDTAEGDTAADGIAASDGAA